MFAHNYHSFFFDLVLLYRVIVFILCCFHVPFMFLPKKPAPDLSGTGFPFIFSQTVVVCLAV